MEFLATRKSEVLQRQHLGRSQDVTCMSSCSSGKATGANIWKWKGTALKAVCSRVHRDQPSLHGQKFIKFLSLNPRFISTYYNRVSFSTLTCCRSCNII